MTTSFKASFKFFYNGIKVNGGPLQKASYSLYKDGTIALYARDYTGFSSEVWEAFTVSNDSDTMTDYFAKDTLRVQPDHALFPLVQAGFNKHDERWAQQRAKREQRYAARAL
jgi:hypothetical protein